MTERDIWSPLGEEAWRQLADGTGASELQLKFAAARFSGASASGAAKLAGYSGDAEGIRRAGYTALRSTAVQNLLELAAINAPGEANISDKEIDAKLARLIRSGDPQVVLKAMDTHAKREATKAAAGDKEEELSPEDDAKAVLGSVFGGLLGVAAMQLGIITQYGPRLSFKAVPLFKELAPNIKADFPEIWQRILDKLDGDCRAEAERLALAPPANLAGLATKASAVTTESENAA